MQRHEAGAYVVLTLAAAGVGALGLVALLVALLDFLNSLTLAVSVSIPLAAFAARRTR